MDLNTGFKGAQFERKAHGMIIVEGQEVASTLQCPHCGAHFISFRGSGARRTFCMKCMAVTCGDPACDTCRPFEKQLEEIEKLAR
jgi:hypothetical protein